MVLFLPASTPFPSEIHPLTSLRFYAALAISLSHILNYMDTDIGIHIPFLDFFPGYLGVDFFFILSGFILTHVYEESFRTQSITKTDFYIKRLARIYPLHALTLLMALELSTILGHLHHNDMIWADNTNRSFLLNLFLMHAWGMSSGASFNVPSWSISAEWFAYLLFPFLLALKGRTRFSPSGFMLFSIAMLLFFWTITPFLAGKPFIQMTYDFGIARIFPEIVYGIALYSWGKNNRIAWSRGKFIIAGIIIATLLTLKIYFLIIVYFGVLILSFADCARSEKISLHSHPVFVWLGNISYAFYLIHILVITATAAFILSPSMPLAFQGIILFMAIPASILFSAALHHAVEKPCRKWIIHNFCRRSSSKTMSS